MNWKNLFRLQWVAAVLVVTASAVAADPPVLREDFAEIAAKLAKAPPQLNVSVRTRAERDDALAAFDRLMQTEYTHNTRFTATRPASFRPWQAFYRHQIAKAISEIRSPDHRDTVRFWNIYSCGYVVRDAETLFAFDLAEPYELHPRDFPEWEWLLANIDVAFFSHVHGDHYQPSVVERIEAGGGKIVTWEKTDPGPHLESGLRFHIHHGAQHAAPNNNYEVVSPSGEVFYHTGDQSYYRHIKNNEPQVHVYFSGYANMSYRMSPRPKAVVPMHLYELHHSGSGRLTRYSPTHHFYDAIEGYDNFMIWGEGVDVEPDKIPPVDMAKPHDGRVPIPVEIEKNKKLVDLFEKLPERYALAATTLLRVPPTLDPNADYPRRRMRVLDAVDRLLMRRIPQDVTEDNAPTAARFDAVRRFYAFMIARGVEEILSAPKVEEGIRLWHFYRCGWVIKQGDQLFGVNVKFPQYLDPPDSPAPREALFSQLDALFVCGGWDGDWMATELPQRFPNMTVVNPTPDDFLEESIAASGEINGIKYQSFPASYQLGAAVNVPTNQFLIVTPSGISLFFPGDATNLKDLPQTGIPVDVAMIGLHHYVSVPEHPLALHPKPKLMVPDDHLYDFAAHEHFGRYSRTEPRWRADELDELWQNQIFWGESFTYVK